MTSGQRPEREARPGSRGRLHVHRVVAAAHAATTRLGRRPWRDPRRITILLIHAWGMGGTIRTVLTMAGELAQDHEVEIVSVLRLRTTPHFTFPPGVAVTALDDQRPDQQRARHKRLQRVMRLCPSLLLHPGDRATRRCSLWTDLRLVRRLRRDPASVLLATRPALNLLTARGAAAGVRTVGEEHLHAAAYRPALRHAIRSTYGKLDALVTLTERDAADYRRVLGNGPRVVAIPNAVPDLQGRAPAPLERPVIVAAGRLTRQKGFDRLIDAFARVAATHPEWRLEIYGHGPARAALERRIASLGLRDRVALRGRVSDLGDRFQLASLFALTSRKEGLPMVVLEAMSHGLPVVAFDCPTGPRELVVDGRNGRLVADGDLAGLATALDELMADRDLRRRYGADAVATASRFAPAAIGQRWRALLTAVRASSLAAGRAPTVPPRSSKALVRR